MQDKVSILLIDKTWLEGKMVAQAVARISGDRALTIKDVARSYDGETGFVHVGGLVAVPWSAILFIIERE